LKGASLDELKLRIKELPISDVIGKYLSLTRKNNQTLAVCPFHDDHSPSMNINDQRGMFYCFVDNIGGDHIKFVQLYKKLEYVEALEDICDQLGWNFQEFVQKKQDNPKFEMGKKILAKATILYKKSSETKYKEQFQHFLTSRGLSEEIAQTYQLGFSPENSALFDYLSSIKNEKDRDYALQLASELSIIKPSKYGEKSHYDTFRERIMFPIWDQFGNVIGFTSRSIREDQKPKYMNSVESFLFNKRNLLYGLHLAKSSIRNNASVIIVEGNMDQIALYAHGFENTVAIMGTALGDSSLQKIEALTKKVYLCLDNDQAGQKAGERINAQFMQRGITPYIVELGEHKDPDDFLQKEGRLAFQEKIDNAGLYIDHLLNKKFPSTIPELTERKLDALHDLFEILAPLGSGLAAKERVAQLSKRLGLQADSATILNSYEDFLKSGKKKTQPQAPQTNQQSESHNQPAELAPAQKVELEEKLSNVEKTLVQILVQHPELFEKEETLELLDFVGSNEVKTYISRLKEVFFEIDESEYQSVVSKLLNDQQFSLELETTASAALYKYRPTTLNEKIAGKMIEDIKRKLQEQKLKTKKEELKHLQNSTQDQDQLNHVLNELALVDRELILLKKNTRKRFK
tara:strand:+ start:69766 stop:71658 length:1893 start_codon:yes stop_codon:yes gene_type:complete